MESSTLDQTHFCVPRFAIPEELAIRLCVIRLFYRCRH